VRRCDGCFDDGFYVEPEGYRLTKSKIHVFLQENAGRCRPRRLVEVYRWSDRSKVRGKELGRKLALNFPDPSAFTHSRKPASSRLPHVRPAYSTGDVRPHGDGFPADFDYYGTHLSP
jgi:hypothetical protein